MNKIARCSFMLFSILVLGIAFQQLGFCDCDNDYLCEPENGETPENCPMDCYCGNSTCDIEFGENRYNCPEDCPPYCGDGICDPDYGENPYTCGDCLGCGNGICEPYFDENNYSCPNDCYCGDGYCDLSHGEYPWNCEQDCLSPTCGDHTCDGGLENWWTCIDCFTPFQCSDYYFGPICMYNCTDAYTNSDPSNYWSCLVYCDCTGL
jgi:hypothetical protein